MPPSLMSSRLPIICQPFIHRHYPGKPYPNILPFAVMSHCFVVDYVPSHICQPFFWERPPNQKVHFAEPSTLFTTTATTTISYELQHCCILLLYQRQSVGNVLTSTDQRQISAGKNGLCAKCCTFPNPGMAPVTEVWVAEISTIAHFSVAGCQSYPNPRFNERAVSLVYLKGTISGSKIYDSVPSANHRPLWSTVVVKGQNIFLGYICRRHKRKKYKFDSLGLFQLRARSPNACQDCF